MSVSGPAVRRYGGNTTCYETEVEPGHHLVVDCGTGLRNLQHDLGDEPLRFTILLTHYHWDHIQGLPAFLPLFERGNRVTIYGPPSGDMDPHRVLDRVIGPPWWPVALGDAAADVSFRTIGPRLDVGPVSVTHVAGRHPQGVVVYRLDGPTRSIVIATDHEAGDDTIDAAVVALAQGADVLIHDAQYTPEQVKSNRDGWGHSSYESAVRTAADAGVTQLILTSHDPDRSDEAVDRLRGVARAGFPHTDAAYEGMMIPL